MRTNRGWVLVSALHPPVWQDGHGAWYAVAPIMSQIEDSIDFGFVEGLRSQVHAEVEGKLKGH